MLAHAPLTQASVPTPPADPAGVTSRRRVLTLTAAGAGALVLALRAAAQTTRPAPRTGLTLEEFLDEVHPLASRLLTADQPEDPYLYEVAARALRLLPLPPVALKPFPVFEHVTFAPRGQRKPITLTQFEVAPGAVIPLHDHAGYNGVMLGLQGEFRVRSFDPAEGPALPADGPVRVRQTADVVVTPGRVSTLARRRDNLHHVTAGKDGGMALDVFTILERPGPGRLFDLAEQPETAGGRIYTATPRPR